MVSDGHKIEGYTLKVIKRLRSELSGPDQAPRFKRYLVDEKHAWNLFKSYKDGEAGHRFSVGDRQHMHRIFVERDTSAMVDILDNLRLYGVKVCVVLGVGVL